MLIRLILAMVCLSVASLAMAAEQWVRYPSGASENDFRYNYPVRVLQLALDKTAKEYGPARAVQARLPMSNARIIEELDKGELLDVATFPASRDLAARFESVPVCIRKGILGIRLFLIDAKNQPRFSAIQNLDALRELRAGQGSDWLDAVVLRGNGLNVVTGMSYDGLFGMLMQGRFDYFPRGLHEPFAEVALRSKQMPELAVEKTLALYYPYPDFFWVKKGNHALAARLYKGLEAAVADGSFERLFESEFGTVIRLAQLDQRRIFRLTNPEFDNMPHAGDPKYWFIDQIGLHGKRNAALGLRP